MPNELISIIVPLYNKEENIAKTIESVQKQSYTNWELIIIDDGSIDNSANIVKAYLIDKRIKYIYKNNGGVSSARNLGIDKSIGKWIIFLDADDYLLPNNLTILYNLALKYKVSISTGNFIVKKDTEEALFCKGKKEGIILNNYKAWFFRNFYPRTGASLFHSEIIKRHKFDESLCRYEDAKSLFDIFRANFIVYTPKPVMVYSLDNTGLSHRSKDVNKDFIFNLEFKNKSFWEKIILSELLLSGFKVYPEHKSLLKLKYNKYLYYNIITKILYIFKRILHKITIK